MDDGRVVLSDPHVELADMLGIEILPELVLRLGEVVLVFQDLAEASGELAVEVGVADHVPCIGAADAYLGNSIVGARLEAPFGSLPLVVLGRVVGLPDMVREGVFLEVIIRGADIGVSEQLPHEHERGVVVAFGVGAIDDDIHAVLVLEVVEGLFLVADDHDDVEDSRLVQLLDLALDEDLAANLEKALRALIGDRCEATGEARREDDGIVHGVGLQRRHALGREASALYEAGL